jgi:hypothetical protein
VDLAENRYFLEQATKALLHVGPRAVCCQPSRVVKVFWFFFSKKNNFLFFPNKTAKPRPRGPASPGWRTPSSTA